ncbi:hypothetical protein ACFVUS_36465 [Nocardia sp. NPDC058058]|uniref:hypothetical protein n=1 Tax=Nocardia sp. NPDC058058 TaxID=3346317 RepID=UPI0036D7D188
MLSRIHPIAGALGLTTILIFWLATVATEVFGSKQAVTTVKQAVPWGLPLLVLALALTGASGFRLAGKASHPIIAAKKRRMPFIAGNGLLVLIPSAITLDVLAGRGDFGVVFYSVQAVEIMAGAVNIVLMSLNIRDGLRLTGRRGGDKTESAGNSATSAEGQWDSSHLG